MHSLNERELEIARIAESKEARTALEKHLDEIVDGVGFRGSQRSGQFLRYIVEQAVAGKFDSLKERAIGIELFGRPPSYDTGEDAIVRVTASDVRKRLLQHYGSCEALPEFRISLPLGSYVPEIVRENHGSAALHKEGHRDPAPSQVSPAMSHLELPPQSLEGSVLAVTPPSSVPLQPARSRFRFLLPAISIAVLIAGIGLAIFGLMWRPNDRVQTAPAAILPWSAIFSSSHPTHLITSDPDISGVQRLTGGNPISVSDYANHNYIPDDKEISPQIKAICANLMGGDKAATVDTRIAVNIAALAQNFSRRIDVQGARQIQFSTLRSDDNFIILGSPWTDPWFSLFNDHLDFRIAFDKNSGREIIQNVHPAASERALYVPTAEGGHTGESYAVIAFLQNPDQNGQVMLLAGINAEGTQAAGNLITDLPRLTTTLSSCGISAAGPIKHFEMLLRVKTMASSPSEFDVISCHTLAGSSS